MIKKLIILRNKSVKLFNEHYPVSSILLLFATVILAFWQIPFLYFWTDDWDLFLKVIHPELALWGMDPGWFGSGPYRYLHTPFMPMYPVFGLQAGPYFAVSILVYFAATISAFLLFLEVTQKKVLAFASAIIYASLGYIGSYTIFHLSNSFQNLGAVIFTTLTLWMLARYYRTGKLTDYLISIALFYASVEIENLRAHGIIFLVFGLTALFAKWSLSPKKIILNCLKLVPYVLIYRQLYSSTLASGNETTVGAFFHSMARDKIFAYFINPFASFSNVIIPDTITKFVFSPFKEVSIVPEILLVILFTISVSYFSIKRKFVFAGAITVIGEVLYFIFNRWAFAQPILSNLEPSASFTSLLGMTLLLSLLFLSLLLWKNKSLLSRLILFGIVLIFGHYIGYFVGIPTYSYLITTDRYLTPSTVGTALVLGVVFSLVRFRKYNLFPILVIGYAAYLILLMNLAASYVIANVSNPARRIHEMIKKVVPMGSINSQSVLFLDFENDPNLKYQMNSTFPPTAMALFYKQGNRVLNTRSFEDYLYSVKNNQMKIDDLLSLYISQWDVINTSSEIHKLLKNPSKEIFIDISKWYSNTVFTRSTNEFATSAFISPRSNDTVGVNPQLEADIKHTSVVPSLISITVSASPIDLSDKKFPYSDVSDQVPDEIRAEDLVDLGLNATLISQLPCSQTEYLLKLDKEHKEFIKTAKVSTATEARYSERDFLIDGLFETNWTGFVIAWANEKKEEIVLDLGRAQEINKLIWVNYLPRSAPTEYDILVSVDNKYWSTVKEVKNGSARIEGEYVIDELGDQSARYIKMVIKNTSSNIAPAISEMWASSLKSEKKLSQYPQQLVNKPLLCSVGSKGEYEKIVNALNGNMQVRVSWLTDGRENYSEINSRRMDIVTDGQPHTYLIYIPAQATTLEKIKIHEFQLPVSVRVSNVSIRSLSFEEIDKLGFIRKPTAPFN